MSEAETRGTRTVDYLEPSGRKQSSKLLERSGMKNSSACDYKRQDVILGMNAISHVPEPYLDPVLLIGGRRFPSATFEWSYRIVTDQSNNSSRNFESCGDPETADEYMEESGSSGNCDRPVPKPRARKVVSLDSNVHPPAATTLPPGGPCSFSTLDHHVNSHSFSTTKHPPARPSTAPSPVQNRTRSASTVGSGESRPLGSPANTTTTQASPGSATYEVPTSESKARPKPPRPPPPKAALIQKYTKQPDKVAATRDKKKLAPIPSATKSKVEPRKPTNDSLLKPTNQRGKQPPPPVSRTQSTASSTSSNDDRGGVHDYEDVDKFLSPPPLPPQPQGGLPPKGKECESPNPDLGERETPAAPVLPPRSTPAKKRSKLSMLVRGGQPDKPTPYRQQDDEDSGPQQQDVGEYSEIKDTEYTDMHPAIHELSPKPKEECVDVYVDIHPKSAVDDYQLMDNDQPGSLYASSDLLANRPDLKL